MNYTFHYLLLSNQSVFHRGVFEKLKDSGLTSGQPKVLDYLKEHDGASQKEIAKGCHVEQASLTAVLNGMENKGLIERRSLNGNRRTCHVFMTNEGKKRLEEVDKAFQYMEEIAFDGITETDIEVFNRVFKKIYDNIVRERGEK